MLLVVRSMTRGLHGTIALIWMAFGSFFFVSLIERYREGRARHYCDESAGVRVPGVFCFLVFAVEVIDFDSSIAKIDRLSKKSLSLFLCYW